MPQIKIPAVYYRGGTSKGVFFKRSDLPEAAREAHATKSSCAYSAARIPTASR